MLHIEFNFNRKQKKFKFSLVHNLDEFGLSIDNALISWSARTKDFSEQSFINYVLSRDDRIICMNENDFFYLKNRLKPT